MRGVAGIVLWLGACLMGAECIFQKDRGVNDWNIKNIGDVEHAGFYHEGGKLRGIFAVSREGVMAMVDHETGALVWRKHLPRQRPVNKLVQRGNFAIVIADGNSTAEVWDLKRGVLLVSKALEQNLTKPIFADAVIIPDKEAKQVTYALMSNEWVRIYKGGELRHSFQAGALEIFIMCFHGGEKEGKVVVGARTGGQVLLVTPDYGAKKLVSAGGVKLQGEYRKASQHLVSVSGTSIKYYSVRDGRMHSKDARIVLQHPSVPSVFLTEDSKSYFINRINSDQVETVTTLSRDSGVPLIGAGEDGRKVVGVQGSGREVLVTLADGRTTVFKTEMRGIEYGVPERVWADSDSENLLIKSSDRSLHCVRGARKLWTRHESLSSIAKFAVRDFQYAETARDSNAGAQSGFVMRILSQISSAKGFIISCIEGIHKLMAKQPVRASKVDKKFLLVMTSYSKLYALNSIDGRILWQKAFSDELLDFVYFKEFDVIAAVLVDKMKRATRVLQLHASNGTFRAAKEAEINDVISRVITIAPYDAALRKKSTNVLLYGTDGRTYWYHPQGGSPMLHQVNLFKVDPESGTVKGYLVSPSLDPQVLQTKSTWTIDFESAKERIVAYASMDPLNRDQYQPIEENGGNIIYKYVNPNLVAVATITESRVLTLYLLNSLNGTIVYTGQIHNVYGTDPVKLVLHENALLLSYFKKYPDAKTTVHNEVLYVEMYFPQIESDVQEMVAKYFAEGVSVGSSNSNLLPKPVVLSKTYVLPFPIKDIALTKSRQGITNKHIVLLNEHNQVLAIPGIVMNARRPSEGLSVANSYENSEFPMYDSIVPFTHSQMITYNLTLSAITSLKVLPHSFESTTLIMATGVDLFLTVFSPESRYDRLGTQFKPWYILLAVAGLIIAAFVMNHFAKRKEAKEAYLVKS